MVRIPILAKISSMFSFYRTLLLVIFYVLTLTSTFAQKYNISKVASVSGSQYNCVSAGGMVPTSQLLPITATFNVTSCGSTSPINIGTVVVKWFVCTSATNCGTLLYQAPSTLSVSASPTVTFTMDPAYISTALGTRYYYCQVSSPSVTGCGFAGTLATNSATIQNGLGSGGYIRLDFINAINVGSPAWTTNPTSVCQNQSYTYTVTPMQGATNYTWVYSGMGVTFSGATTSNSVTVTYSQTATNGSLTVVGRSARCTASTTVSTSPIVSVAPVITTENLSGGSTCLNTAFASNPSLVATGTGLTYQWYQNTTQTNIGGTLITNATSSSYTPPVNVEGTYYFYCVVSNGTCTTTSNPSNPYVVTPSTAIITQPLNLIATGCQNGLLPSLSVTASNASLYQWYSNSTASTINGTPISGATSSTFTPSSATPGNYYYYVQVTGCGSVLSSVSGPFLVRPNPTSSILTSDYTNNQTTICTGNSGSVRAVITDGASPYTVSLSNGSILNSYVSNTPIILFPSSTSTVSISSVTDAYGCVSGGISGSVTMNVVLQDTWIGPTSGGLWSNSANWSCGVPNSNTDVVIPIGNTVQINSTGSAKSITINGSLVFQSGGNLSVFGNLFSNGGVSFMSGATPKITFSGSTSQSIFGSALISIWDLEIANVGGVVNNASILDIYGTVTLPLPTSQFDADGWANNSVIRLRSLSPTHSASVGVLSDPSKMDGKITIERNIGTQVRAWRYVSSPVYGFAAGVELWEWLANKGFYLYDERVAGDLNTGWVRLSSSFYIDENTEGRGFFSYATPSVWVARGTMSKGDIDFPITYTNTSYTSSDGWNLVGNPYPSPIIWNNADWVKTNVNSVIYAVDTKRNVWLTWDSNLEIGNDPAFKGVIPMGQAFWISTTGPNPFLRVTESAKRPTSPTIFGRSGEEINILDVEFSNDTISDRVIVGLVDGTTEGFDSEFDAVKLPHSEFGVSLVSSDNISLAHQIVTSVDGIQIPLNITAQPGTYELKFTDRNGQGNFDGLYLVDYHLNTAQIIKSGEGIKVEITENPQSYQNRFIVSNGNVKTRDNGNDVKIFPNPTRDRAQIVYTSDSPVNVELTSSDGLHITQFRLTPVNGIVSGTINLSDLHSGVYIVWIDGLRHKLVKH